VKSARVKFAEHAQFDKGMNDIPASDLPPNVQHLQCVQHGYAILVNTGDLAIPDFSFTNPRFLDEVEKMLALEPLAYKKDCTSALAELDIYHNLVPEPYEELTLCIDELRSIHILRQDPPDAKDLSTTQILHLLVHTLSAEALTPEERNLKRFTHHKLKQLSIWPLWEAGEHDQLDKFHNIQLYGEPCFAQLLCEA
jgi:hypothetical protein